jgi:hypothetical protein
VQNRRPLGGLAVFSWRVDEIGRGEIMAFADKRIAFLGQAQEVLENLFPGSMTVAGVTFAVARSGEERTEIAEPGGFEEAVRILVRVRLAFVPSDGWPKETLATMDGRSLRVSECLREVGDVAWSVELETE